MPQRTNEELYEEAERQLIGEAIAETEKEVFDSAFDNAPDDNDADTSLEQMDSDDTLDEDIEGNESEEGESEEDDAPEQDGEEEDASEADHETDHQPQRGIPSGRLREEANARRAAEAEVRELRSRLENLERVQRQSPQQQQQPPPQPDMFADPDGWAQAQRASIRQEFRQEMVNASLADAAEQHGEAFQEAFKSITSLNPQNPTDQATVQRIWNAPNPGREIMRWHQQQTLLRDIGNDPNAYIERQIQERLSDPKVRQSIMDGMRNEAMNGQGGPRTRVRLPSLNSASGGTSHRSRDASRDTARTTASLEREIFDSAWDD